MTDSSGGHIIASVRTFGMKDIRVLTLCLGLLVVTVQAHGGEAPSAEKIRELEAMIAEIETAFDQIASADVAVQWFSKTDFCYDPFGKLRWKGRFADEDLLRYVRAASARTVVVYVLNGDERKEREVLIPFAKRILASGAKTVYFHEPDGNARRCFLTINRGSNQAIHRTPRPARLR